MRTPALQPLDEEVRRLRDDDAALTSVVDVTENFAYALNPDRSFEGSVDLLLGNAIPDLQRTIPEGKVVDCATQPRLFDRHTIGQPAEMPRYLHSCGANQEGAIHVEHMQERPWLNGWNRLH